MLARYSHTNLQLVGIIEVDMNGRHHPGVEEIGQDLPSDGVRDKMEVEWVPSDTEGEQTFVVSQKRKSSPIKLSFLFILYKTPGYSAEIRLLCATEDGCWFGEALAIKDILISGWALSVILIKESCLTENSQRYFMHCITGGQHIMYALLDERFFNGFLLSHAYLKCLIKVFANNVSMHVPMMKRVTASQHFWCSRTLKFCSKTYWAALPSTWATTSSECARRLFHLPVKQNRLDQSDDVSARIVPRTHDGNMNGLWRERQGVQNRLKQHWCKNECFKNMTLQLQSHFNKNVKKKTPP